MTLRIELLENGVVTGTIIADEDFAERSYPGLWRLAAYQGAPQPSAPQKVTRRQARKALVLAGLFDLVQPSIDAITDPLERQLAQIDWDDSQEFARDWPLLLSIGQSLGLSDADIDGLFSQAGTL